MYLIFTVQTMHDHMLWAQRLSKSDASIDSTFWFHFVLSCVEELCSCRLALQQCTCTMSSIRYVCGRPTLLLPSLITNCSCLIFSLSFIRSLYYLTLIQRSACSRAVLELIRYLYSCLQTAASLPLRLLLLLLEYQSTRPTMSQKQATLVLLSSPNVDLFSTKIFTGTFEII